MNQENMQNTESIKKIISLTKQFVNFDKEFAWLKDLENKIAAEGFWDNPDAAILIIKEKEQRSIIIDKIISLEKKLSDCIDMLDLAEQENDESLENELSIELSEILKEAKKLQIESMLSEEHDNCNCFIEINAGAGGTEAQDWAEMLARMYMRWAESKHHKLEITDKNIGEEAGVKSIVLKINGAKVFGWLKKETGVHRLVRISPFDSNARRHTSFASVFVSPEVDENIHIEINECDLRIDTYRASGAGGQHVNKTDSAVRITHIPTGIVVQCQTDRSQHRNRAIAMAMLKSKLYALKLEEKNASASSKNSEKTDIAWGHQIRSYVLQPYQLVKDTRTGVEKGNSQGVLDGDIDDFLEAAIALSS